MQLQGQGYHRKLEIKLDVPSSEPLIDVLILVEILKNDYFFDYYELQVIIILLILFTFILHSIAQTSLVLFVKSRSSLDTTLSPMR